LLTEDKLGCVSNGKHQAEQGTKNTADEQAVENVLEEVTCHQTYGSAHGDEPDKVLPAGVKQFHRHSTAHLPHQ